MNITLSRDVEKRVEELVERGDYPNANAVVEEALGSFLDVERDEDLDAVRRRLASADAEIERGEFVEYDADTVGRLAEDLQKRGEKRLADLRRAKPKG